MGYVDNERGGIIKGTAGLVLGCLDAFGKKGRIYMRAFKARGWRPPVAFIRSVRIWYTLLIALIVLTILLNTVFKPYL